jgi:hypothetical protein
VTLYAAACDTRIRVAISSCAYNALVDSTGHVIHCDCNLVPGIHIIGELWDVAGLIAPRHLLCAHGHGDHLLHPVAEVDRAVAELSKIYHHSAPADRFSHVYGDGGHRYYANIMWPFARDAFKKLDVIEDAE